MGPSLYLDSIRRREDSKASGSFPWSIPSLRRLEELAFPTPVTFLVGDNGSGKSTLLEGLACGMQAYAVGSVGAVVRDPLLQHAKIFAQAFYFARKRRAKIKMFLRAEDVYGHVKAELAEIEDLEAEAALARASERPSRVTIGMLEGMARSIRESDPDGRSHGETFVKILGRRLHGGGLYFLDEPESPLSPARQLALLGIIRDSVAAGGQFIIATHSPLLLALPGATIYHIGESDIAHVRYEDVPNVAFMKAFLANPARFIAEDE
ncbi:AAA family ATPase [Pelagibacterium halotolerans]|uniref:AAA family ATPase n=1 Tax=Pelagibacterium halotolerans TaxID=531813 RepID=UPI00384B4460